MAIMDAPGYENGSIVAAVGVGYPVSGLGRLILAHTVHDCEVCVLLCFHWLRKPG